MQHGILHLEKGFLYTSKELLINPGTAIRKFIESNRARHYKPIGFVIITSILYTFVKQLVHFNELEDKQIFSGNSAKLIIWTTEHYNYSNLIEIVFVALSLTWFFKKRGYNYFEYVVLLCYVNGFGMFIGIICMIVSKCFHVPFAFEIGYYLIIAYLVWAIGQFFSDNKSRTFLKAFLAFLVGSTLYLLTIYLTGIFLDVLHVRL